MQAKKKLQTPPDPEEGLYDDVEILETDDETLEVIKGCLKQVFEKHHKDWDTKGKGVSNAHYQAMISAGNGFAAVCAEQRERAMLKAHQQHFRKS